MYTYMCMLSKRRKHAAAKCYAYSNEHTHTPHSTHFLLLPLQVRGWRGFAKGEFWYIILSLTSKQLLAWINYGGTRRFAQ